jgi:hypothetical protein
MFERGFPTPDTARRIQDEQDQQRARKPTASSIRPCRWRLVQGPRDAGVEDNKAAMIMAAGPGR